MRDRGTRISRVARSDFELYDSPASYFMMFIPLRQVAEKSRLLSPNTAPLHFRASWEKIAKSRFRRFSFPLFIPRAISRRKMFRRVYVDRKSTWLRIQRNASFFGLVR